MRKFVLPLILTLMCGYAQASLILNLSILHHKGIDKGITLLSEFHSKEEVPHDRIVKIKMREGVEVRLSVEFLPIDESMGPSSRLNILGKVYAESGKEMAVLSEGKHVEIGQDLKFQVKDDFGQLLEVVIRPEFQ